MNILGKYSWLHVLWAAFWKKAYVNTKIMKYYVKNSLRFLVQNDFRKCRKKTHDHPPWNMRKKNEH